MKDQIEDKTMTYAERRAYCRRVIEPYANYLTRGYTVDVLNIAAERGLRNHESGSVYTTDQVRHTKAGNLALMELATIIAEVGRRNKEATERMNDHPIASYPPNPMDKAQLIAAIDRIFSQTKIKKELRTSDVTVIVAGYLGVHADGIPDELMLQALRETDFAVPRPRLRGSSYLAWMFVSRPVTPTKATVKTKARSKSRRPKSVLESLGLKSA